MSNHVTDWLNAYLDGELHGNRLQQVEAHLAECEVCQADLESLEQLSDLLQEVPMPEFTPPERFASQVSLRLPHSKPATSRKSLLEIGWWMIPVGLLAAWFFISVSFLVSDMLAVANNFGLLTSISDWMRLGSPNGASWSTILGRFGVLSGGALDFAASAESFTRTSLWQIGLQTAIALLYLSWIAIWWARYQRRENVQLLEG
jgi:predicted anti-sigma-YlaC factor YlaD